MKEVLVQGKINMPEAKKIEVKFRSLKPGETADGEIMGRPVRAVYILDKETKEEFEKKKDKDKKLKEILERLE